MSALLLLQAASTWFLVGLIWTVQLVHYPLFAQVGDDAFTAYAITHRRWMTRLVLPVMGLEVATSAWLIWQRPPGVPGAVIWLGLGLIGLIWLSTAFIQTPLHQRLSQSFSATAYRALLRSNWGRVAAWSLRGLLVLWMLWRLRG